MTSDEQAVRQAHSTWIDAVNAGDLTRLVALMTDDAVFLTPGQPPSDRDAFAANFATAQQQIRFRCLSELEEVVTVGDVAYTRSRDALHVTPRAGDDATRLTGYRMTVYRRRPAGPWLLARDAHTLTPAATSSRSDS